MKSRFGAKEQFLSKVNPDTQVFFALNTEAAVMGDYPTLMDICVAYGNNFSTEWLIPLIDNLALYTGVKNLNGSQELELARIIAIEYRHLKITEILLFFARFKAGRYGRFYVTVDPMVITCALRDFMRERNELISYYEREQKEREESMQPKITWEEYCQMKGISKPNPLTQL